MVLAEKNSENARNGRRSRGPSPNGHVQAESTSEDESTGTILIHPFVLLVIFGNEFHYMDYKYRFVIS